MIDRTTHNTHLEPETALEGCAVRVRGLVQGVGFRPTVWRIAQQCGLWGDVCNDGDGVLIRIWGTSAAISTFLQRLPRDAPPLSRIDAIEHAPIHETPPWNAFHIVASQQTAVSTGITPDAATCPECVAELFDPANRRYRYPFINCTHCGPRLSIIRALPYDRAQTSMAAFPMCPTCTSEYDTPADRRFHAQPNACPECGPHMWLEKWNEENSLEFSSTEPLSATAQLIKAGAIIAIKGIGGFHLACDATNAETVRQLRARKRRYDKPFALMARDVMMIRRYANVSEEEETALNTPAAPIVLLRCGGESLAPEVAPHQTTLGFMLPYAPLLHLLMHELDAPIVLTSGNLSNEPQCTTNDNARTRLGLIADYGLLHNRDIVNRVDDSVIRFTTAAPQMIRRARGYAPAPLRLPAGFENAPPVLAMGAALKSTFCLFRNGEAILSQHIGDLDDPATHADYRHALALYREMFQFRSTAIAVDLHPDYPSSRWGEVLSEAEGVPLQRIQHHHAHVAACLAEARHARDAGPVLGVVLDGLGLGDDGTLWGGEFLFADYTGYQRLAHFTPVPMLGGDVATREPWRNAYAHIAQAMGWETAEAQFFDLPLVKFLRTKPLGVLNTMMERGLNAPLASSAGRLFDAVAAAVGICTERVSYEGQAAIELEALAESAMVDARPYTFDNNNAQLAFVSLWLELLTDLANAVSPAVIAARFHKGLIVAITELAQRLAKEHDLNKVALTGGVFQNRLLLEGVNDTLRRAGFTVLLPAKIPSNDGGLALGQAIICSTRF